MAPHEQVSPPEGTPLPSELSLAQKIVRRVRERGRAGFPWPKQLLVLLPRVHMIRLVIFYPKLSTTRCCLAGLDQLLGARGTVE
jgi:hypothetical protein